MPTPRTSLLLCASLLTACISSPRPQTQVHQCQPAPFAQTLYLRGAMSSWAALDEYAFVYQCDRYYLNVDLTGAQDFKIADAAWTAQSSYGAALGQLTRLEADIEYLPAVNSAAGNTVNLSFSFNGEHTVQFKPGADGRPALTISARHFIDPNARIISDPLALSLRFDSRSSEHKQPFGAVHPGTRLNYAVRAMPGLSAVTLVLERRRLAGNQDVLQYQPLQRIAMRPSELTDDQQLWQASWMPEQIGVYGYFFEVEIGEQHYIYQNNKDQIYWTRERGSGGLGVVGEKPQRSETIRRFRQTVYAADFNPPEWAPDMVYYYIFPERFRNGNRGNDPKPGQTRFRDQTVEFHDNWNDRPYLSAAGDGSDDLYSNDFFGGDLDGIIEKLGYLQTLGINTLYLTPIFTASTNHKYDTADYRSIDPGFGEQQDFQRLARQAGQHGIRVIVDASLNHSGSDSIYFDRYAAYPQLGAFEGGVIQPDSAYADWYRFDPAQSDPQKQYQGWTGVHDLPELNKSSASFRRFAYGTGGVMQHWLDAGAAGWRMDVAPWVPDDFWREWRTAVKQHQPQALTVAETWFDASGHLLGDMFDATMNYIFRNTVLDYANGGRADRLYVNLEHLREAYPPPSLYAAMNLLSTHDSARSLHVFGYHDEQTPAETIQLAKQKYRLALLFQMSYPGAPAVFYADEVGVTGGDDPFNRVTYPWADQGGQPDLDMLNQFQRLIAMRHAHPVLRRGSLAAPLYLDEHVIVLLRQLGEQSAIVALNNDQSPRTVQLRLPEHLLERDWIDVLSQQRSVSTARTLTIEIPALYGRVLLDL